MVTYTWTIANTEYDAATGGITVIHWRCEGTDGENTASSYGTTSHSPDPADAGFIAYADVTEADALGWAKAELDADAIEAAIADQINAMANPTTLSGTPWA